MHDKTTSYVRTQGGYKDEFSNPNYHWFTPRFGSKPFTLMMDELTKSIQDDVSWCILFADDIILVDEIKERVNKKLEKIKKCFRNEMI